MARKHAYVTGALVMSMFSPLAATHGLKLSNKNVLAPASLGKVKLVHEDDKGFTLYTNGKKRAIPLSACTPELRTITSGQLATYQKAAYISVHEQSDGEFALRSHVRGEGGVLPWAQIGEWAAKTLMHWMVAQAIEDVVTKVTAVTVDEATIVQPGANMLPAMIEQGGLAGTMASVVTKGAPALMYAEAAACGAAAAAGAPTIAAAPIAPMLATRATAASASTISVPGIPGATFTPIPGTVDVARAFSAQNLHQPIYPTPTGAPLFAETIHATEAASNFGNTQLAQRVAVGSVGFQIGKDAASGYLGSQGNTQFNAVVKTASSAATGVGIVGFAAAGTHGVEGFQMAVNGAGAVGNAAGRAVASAAPAVGKGIQTGFSGFMRGACKVGGWMSKF